VKSRPAGFTLAEVVVAMTLLTVGLLAVAASALTAAHMFARAEVQERALRTAESVLDSLATLPQHGAGELPIPGGQLIWSGSDGSGMITVRLSLAGQPPFALTTQP
jgi:prepilin-type N-terminal cleavage/methylation domain-containing protein